MLLRHGLDPVLGNRYPYLLQFVAMLAAARLLGFGPGIVVPADGSPACSVSSFYTLSQPVPLDRPVLVGAPVRLSVLCLPDLAARSPARSNAAQSRSANGIAAPGRARAGVAAQLRAIVESSEDAIISKDLDGIIRSWNHGAERIFGYPKEEALGQPISLVVPEERRHEEAGILERIRQGLPGQTF